MSLYADFAAPVTTGLSVFLTNAAGDNVAIDYATAVGVETPPVPDGTPANTTVATTTAPAATTTAPAATTAAPLPLSPGAVYTSSVVPAINTISGFKKLNVFEVTGFI